MNECFKCGVSEDRALLFGAISEKGIVKICRKCSFEENLPIMKSLKEEVEKRQTVHERLFRLSGVEVKDGKNRVNKQDENLRKIADQNFSRNVLDENPFGMVDNFHWIIMRARRSKKLTQRQFAEAIEESEEAIKMAEKRVLPRNNFMLVNKIENYLGIRIKDEFARERSFDKEIEKIKENFSQNVEEDKVKFDEITIKTLTIADLQEMKKKREAAPSHGDDLRKKRPQANPKEGARTSNEVSNKIDLDKEDISQEEIDRILFGGK